MYALSARHCGPHSYSIKKTILNWRDWLLVDGQAECLEDQMLGKCFLGWKEE